MSEQSSSKLWKEALKEAFKDVGSEIPEDFKLHDKLEEQGIRVHGTVKNRYDNLAPSERKWLLADLKRLAEEASLEPWERRDLYERMARRYARFFSWEPDRSPGWLIFG
jgi:beta-phosphoglucomutase-like phosphatase (HAD superfamily)